MTLILVGALLAGSAVLVVLQMSSNRSTDLTRSGLESLYCAEAGLSAARPTVLANYQNWNAALAYGVANSYASEPPLISGAINHALAGDGSATDYMVVLKDNYDEPTGVTDNPSVDNDLRVFIISTCLKYPDNPKQVEELVQYSGGGQCYQSQLGGCGGNGNSN